METVLPSLPNHITHHSQHLREDSDLGGIVPKTHSFIPSPAIATVAQGEGIWVPLSPSFLPPSSGFLLSCLPARRVLKGQPPLPTGNWRNHIYSWGLNLSFDYLSPCTAPISAEAQLNGCFWNKTWAAQAYSW